MSIRMRCRRFRIGLAVDMVVPPHRPYNVQPVSTFSDLGTVYRNDPRQLNDDYQQEGRKCSLCESNRLSPSVLNTTVRGQEQAGFRGWDKAERRGGE